MDGDDFKRALAHIESAIERELSHTEDLFEPSKLSALAVARRVLPADDSSFQWSPQGSGIGANLVHELQALFDRMVESHDVDAPSETRTEKDVWRTFARPLAEKKIIDRLRPKQISSASDTVKFQHAWKNGRWNCLVPVSFDLVDPQRVHDKAVHWVGQAKILEGANDPFKLYMLIGEPSHKSVLKHFDRALKILGTMPGHKEIYREADAEELSEHIAKDLRDHDESTA